MTQVLIVATPPGEAPEWVRKEWVGLTMPVAKNVPSRTYLAGVVSGRKADQFTSGYIIETRIALQILKEKNAGAYQWWVGNVSPMPPWLVFDSCACQLL